MIEVIFDAPFVACELAQTEIEAKDESENLSFVFSCPEIACDLEEEKIQMEVKGLGILSGQTPWGKIQGNIDDQTDLKNALDEIESIAQSAYDEKHTHSNISVLNNITGITNTATSGSTELITAGGVYSIVGDIESILEAML